MNLRSLGWFDLKLLFKIFKKKDVREKREECKHEWKPTSITYQYRCEVCQKLLRMETLHKCKKCGEYWTKVEVFEDFNIVIVGRHVSVGENYRRWLCKQCYERFKKLITELENELMKSAKIYDFQSTQYREVKFLSTKHVLAWINDFVDFISKPSKMEYYEGHSVLYGIGFFAKPKNPLEQFYKVVIPYTAIIDELKAFK